MENGCGISSAQNLTSYCGITGKNISPGMAKPGYDRSYPDQILSEPGRQKRDTKSFFNSQPYPRLQV